MRVLFGSLSVCLILDKTQVRFLQGNRPPRKVLYTKVAPVYPESHELVMMQLFYVLWRPSEGYGRWLAINSPGVVGFTQTLY